MAKPTTKITPLDPAFHGESNYEVGLEDLLAEKRDLVAKLEADPQTHSRNITIYKGSTSSGRGTLAKLSHWHECLS